jgi:hypothetical protein
MIKIIRVFISFFVTVIGRIYYLQEYNALSNPLTFSFFEYLFEGRKNACVAILLLCCFYFLFSHVATHKKSKFLSFSYFSIAFLLELAFNYIVWKVFILDIFSFWLLSWFINIIISLITKSREFKYKQKRTTKDYITNWCHLQYTSNTHIVKISKTGSFRKAISEINKFK